MRGRTRRAWPIRPVLVLIVLIGMIALASALGTGQPVAANHGMSRGGASAAATPVLPVGTPMISQPVGAPAIHPRSDLAKTAGPSFTKADVVQYVAAHPIPFAVRGAAAPVVASIEFLTSQQVSTELGGESTGMPDSALLCLVHLSGTFESDRVPLGGTAYPYYDGVMVFDAHTGNLLISNVG